MILGTFLIEIYGMFSSFFYVTVSTIFVLCMIRSILSVGIL